MNQKVEAGWMEYYFIHMYFNLSWLPPLGSNLQILKTLLAPLPHAHLKKTTSSPPP